jgi:hypothetical protein
MNSHIPWYKHKHFLVGAGIILGLFLFAELLVVLIKWSIASTSQNSSIPTPVLSETSPLVTYKDPSGFLISYSGDLTKNTHDENTIDYAQVEFTQSAHPGGITIWVSDALTLDGSPLPDLPSWIKTQTKYELSSTIDSTLGEKPAVKFLSKKGDRIMGIATVNDSIVWIIEATVYDEVYWQKVFNQIVQSFAFVPPQYSNDTTTNNEDTTPSVDTSNDYSTEEEVIE